MLTISYLNVYKTQKDDKLSCPIQNTLNTVQSILSSISNTIDN